MDKQPILENRRLWITTVVLFLLLIVIFDRNNLIDRWKLKRQINELRKQKEYYMNRLEQDSALLENLKDDAFLEEYAREQYLFKKDDEDIYLIR